MRPARPADGIAWITGASTGIGRAVAEALLAAGWRVALTARSRPALEAIAAAHPGRVLVQPGDVCDAAAMQAAATAIAQEAPVALLLCNAGAWQPMHAQDFDLASFRRQMEVNVLGTANTLAAVMPAMIARGAGQIGIVASIAGYGGLPMSLAYGATKSALIHMAEALKFDLDRAGVMVQVINPGFVKTPMTESNRFPMPFLLTPEDAAARILRGLAGGRFEIAFPAPLVWPFRLARMLPYALYFRAVGRATKS